MHRKILSAAISETPYTGWVAQLMTTVNWTMIIVGIARMGNRISRIPRSNPANNYSHFIVREKCI